LITAKNHMHGAERSLIAQRLLEALICLCHLCQFPELTANVSLETGIVIDARRMIVFLPYQFLEVSGERGLLVRGMRGFQSTTDPFLGGRLVIFVLCLIPAPVRRRLIQLGSLEPALQPFPDLLAIPRFLTDRSSLTPNLVGIASIDEPRREARSIASGRRLTSPFRLAPSDTGKQPLEAQSPSGGP
jgi:hypothetical protein